jgi:hypothetical protein
MNDQVSHPYKTKDNTKQAQNRTCTLLNYKRRSKAQNALNDWNSNMSYSTAATNHN